MPPDDWPVDVIARTRKLFESLPMVSVWATDRDGRIVLAIGGGLALMGLTSEAVEGSHITAWPMPIQRMHTQAMRGLSELERTARTQSPTTGTGPVFARPRETLTQWGPYYDANPDGSRTIAGMVAVSMDVTGLADDTVHAILGRIEDWTPLLTQLTVAEVKRIETLTALESRRAEMLNSRWSFLLRGGEWVQERMSLATSIVFLAAALYIAKTLGVVDLVLGLVRGGIASGAAP